MRRSGRIARLGKAIPWITIQPGLELYHGTKCAGDFTIPDGPAWFAFSHQEAKFWIDWASDVPRGRRLGERRVLGLRLNERVNVYDTRAEPIWREFCEILTGDPEAGGGTVAEALKLLRLPGWYGQRELLLTNPSDFALKELTSQPDLSKVRP